MPPKKKVTAAPKSLLKAPQVKPPEKHHWYFEKKDITPDKYGRIVTTFFPDGMHVTEELQYAVVSMHFQAIKIDNGFDVIAIAKGFVQLKSPAKCTKEQFLDLFKIDVDAYEPDDLVCLTTESNIQADSFRLLVLNEHYTYMEGGEIRRRGPPKIASEVEAVSQPTEAKTQINFKEELLQGSWTVVPPPNERSSTLANGNCSKSSRSVIQGNRSIPIVAATSVAVGRDSLETSATNTRQSRKREIIPSPSNSPIDKTDQRKRPAQSTPGGSPRNMALYIPSNSHSVMSTSVAEVSKVTLPSSSSNVLSTATDEDRKRARFLVLFQNTPVEELDKMFPNGHPGKEDGFADNKSDHAE